MNEILDLLGWLCFFWATLLLLYTGWRSYVSRQTRTKRRKSQSVLYGNNSPVPHIAFTVRPGWLVLDVQPTRQNGALPRSRYLRLFYSVGALLTLLAFFCLPLGFLWRVYSVLRGSPRLRLQSRAGYPLTVPLEPALLIPGVTVPLSELPVMFLAGFIAIAWHEAGHAIAAAREGVPLLSFGFVILLMFPGAYVSLPEETLALLTPDKRLGVIAAGIWHNTLLALVAALGLWSGLVGMNSLVFGYLGYADYNERGVIVQTVSRTSPLASLLPIGTLVSQLDDLELHDSVLYRHWDKHLLGATTDGYSQLGWCLDQAQWKSSSEDCCAPAMLASSNTTQPGRKGICFEAVEGGETGCLDPSTMLGHQRCVTSCNEQDICVKPAVEANLLRITVSSSDSQQQNVVFYQGSRRKLWEEVRVASLLAPYWLPQWLPTTTERFWLTLQSVSTSLAAFNLLPLPRLDGGEVLSVILDHKASTPVPASTGGLGGLLCDWMSWFGASALVRWASARKTVATRCVYGATAAALAFHIGTIVWLEAVVSIAGTQ